MMWCGLSMNEGVNTDLRMVSFAASVGNRAEYHSIVAGDKARCLLPPSGKKRKHIRKYFFLLGPSLMRIAIDRDHIHTYSVPIQTAIIGCVDCKMPISAHTGGGVKGFYHHFFCSHLFNVLLTFNVCVSCCYWWNEYVFAESLQPILGFVSNQFAICKRISVSISINLRHFSAELKG